MVLQSKKVHYAWIICFIGFYSMIINMGFNGNLYATYLPFIEGQGYSGSQGSMIISVRSISGLVSTILMGLYFRKLGLRFGIAFSTFLGALSMLIMANAKSIWMYYLAAAIDGVPFSLGATVSVSMLVNNWFVKKRGEAFGITAAGSGIATCVLPPIIERAIRMNGLSVTFHAICIIELFSAVLIFVVMRSTPESMHMLPFGAENKSDTKELEDTATVKNPNHCSVVAMLIMFFIVGGAHCAATSHVSVLGESTGYGSITSAAMFSVYGIVMAAAKLGFGEISDRIGAYRTGAITLLIYGISIIPIMFLNGNNRLPCYISSIMIGIGGGGYAMGLSMWTSDFSTRKTYSSMLKKFQLGNMAGSMIFSALPGIIADHTGSYQIAYLVLCSMIITGLVLLIFSYSRRNHDSLK